MRCCLNPLDGIVLPKKKSPEIQLLDDAEQKTLQQYIGTHQNRSTLGTALSMTTGLRIGELCPLQWRDIDLEKRILTVTKTMQRIQCPTASGKTKLIITDPKSESSRRQIPIPECMVSFLLKFKGKPNEYILTGTEKPIEPRAMQYRFQTILKNAKLPSVHFHLRSDWEEIKYDIMYEVCKAKFTQHPDLAQKLLDTGDEMLVEGNTWGDKVWGQVKGEGQNMLGQILMRIRDELRKCDDQSG